MIHEAIEANVKTFLPENVPHDDWDLMGLRDHYLGWLIGPEDLHFTKSEIEDLEQEHVVNELQKKADELYERKSRSSTSPIMREVERVVLLRNVDQEWMDHIDAMEQLQDGIRLRAYAHQDPVVEYRLEGFEMFDGMIAAIREDTAKMISPCGCGRRKRRPSGSRWPRRLALPPQATRPPRSSRCASRKSPAATIPAPAAAA